MLRRPPCSTLFPYTPLFRSLTHKGVEYEDIRIDKETQLRAEMEQRSGRTSVPQIFIDDIHVGGCDELLDLERKKELDQYVGLTTSVS